MRPVSDPLSRALPFDAWPQLDRHTWEYATTLGDVFSDAGTAAHWRPATTVSYMGSYGRWLRFLDQNGLLDPEVMPDERVTQDRIGRYISTLESRLKPVSIWSYVSDLHNVLYRIAPEHDWSWLRHIINRLHLKVPRGSISPDDLLPIGDLYQAGFDLMENATREAALHSGHGNGSTYYRDGLMISMLTVTLLRPGNFARITLDNQLVRCPDLYQLTIPADEIKNGRHYETGIPDSLTRPLDQYLDHVRPQLLGNNYTPRLWIAYNGTPMSQNAVANSIKTNTQRYLGKAVSPHRFRHCAATSIATVSPELSRIIAPLLEHNRITTSEIYYNRARTMDASRRHADALDALRHQLHEDFSGDPL